VAILHYFGKLRATGITDCCRRNVDGNNDPGYRNQRADQYRYSYGHNASNGNPNTRTNAIRYTHGNSYPNRKSYTDNS
jgi:hypothetical protein